MDAARLPAQAGAVAVRALPDAEEPGQFLADGLGLGVAVASLHVGDDALEGVGPLERIPPVVDVGEAHLLLAAAVQDDVLQLLGELLEGGVDIEAVVLGQGCQHVEVVEAPAVPAPYRPLGEAGLRVQHDALGVEVLLHPQAVAGAARPGGVVEGKQLGFQFADAVTALGTGEAGGEQRVLAAPVHVADGGEAVGEPQGGFEGLRQPEAHVVPHLEPVNHHLDGVLLVLGEFRHIVQVGDDAVDSRPHEAPGAQFLEHMQVLPLALAHHGRQQHQLGALLSRQHRIDHLAHGLGLQGDAVVRAVGVAHPRKQQPQVVVDLRDGAHGGTGVVGGGLLLDGDGRGQALHMVQVRLFHHRQELPGVGGQGFHIPALPLGVEGVESQRGLPRAGQAGDDHQLVPGNVQVDVLEVVGSRPADLNGVH